MDTKKLLSKLVARKDLTEGEVGYLLEGIINGNLSSVQASSFLTGLRIKGESVSEILGLIKKMRSHMVSVKTKGIVIDIVGSGGDGYNTFNISTTASFIAAGAGIKVAKHGNRAASSKCGSADVLESLGVNINLTKAQAAKVLEKVGMVFLFAPYFHPATKNIVSVRKELGFRTVFNFLGPFLNPARVKFALIGLPSEESAKKLSEVATKLGFKRLIIFSSRDGMDEISISGPTTIFELSGSRVKEYTITPSDFGIKIVNKNQLVGGDSKESAALLKSILSGETGPKRDIAVLNAAFGIYVSGKAKTPQKAFILAQQSIDEGKALAVLENLIKETNQYV